MAKLGTYRILFSYIFLTMFFWGMSFAQTPSSSKVSQSDIPQLVRDVFHNEITADMTDHSLWRFREIKTEGGKTRTLQICQTREGAIERLIAIDGQPLTTKQQNAEDQRINHLIHHRELLREKAKKQREDDEQTRNLMKVFPDAFLFMYEGADGDLIKLHFAPNPAFYPSGHATAVFHHMEGTLVVDSKQKRVEEINGRLMHEVKFAGGLLGHLDKGGSFHVTQGCVGNGHWDMLVMDVQMNGKLLFFKTIAVEEKEVYSNYEAVSPDITLDQAADLLRENSDIATVSYMQP